MTSQDSALSREHRESISRPHTPKSDNLDAKQTVICVFCGSQPGTSPAHLEAARSLAHALHDHNIKLVYGGGTTGLMGEVARTLVALSGPLAVHGVIPNALVQFEQKGITSAQDASKAGDAASEIDEKIYGRTTVVPNMHARKQLMAKEVIEGGPGSGFVALAGGYGTFEELFEMTTWHQLGIHKRGVVVFNVEGYYDRLLEFVSNSVKGGFISSGNAGIIAEARDAQGCVQALRDYKIAEGRFKLDWTQN